MKKNIYLYVSGIVAIAFLFSSCKSLTNFSIEKRQHRGGYYVDWGNGKVKTDPANTNASASKRSKDSQKKNAPVIAESTAKKSSATATPAPEKTTAQKATAKESVTTNVSARNSFKVKEEPIAQSEYSANNVSNSYAYSFNDYHAEGASDTPTWVLAVLCILLPPLAVFLVYGVGNEFWISLILTLLFWIPGVIYAFVMIF